MIHEMKLQEVYFNKIKTSEKTIEIRLNDEKRQKIKTGDKIVFYKEPLLQERLEKTVKNLCYYSSFSEMLNSLDAKSLGFENKSKQEIENIYHQFYLTEKERQHGVVAIELEKD